MPCPNVTGCVPSCVAGLPSAAARTPCSQRYALTSCDLTSILAATGGCGKPTTAECTDMVGPLNAALEAFDMNCPLRIAAFIAQVLHETARLGTFYQPLDDGAGGKSAFVYDGADCPPTGG
jgi:hypothetical protein